VILFWLTHSFVHAEENVHGTYTGSQVINFQPQLLVCDHHVRELSIWLDDLICDKLQLLSYEHVFGRKQASS